LVLRASLRRPALRASSRAGATNPAFESRDDGWLVFDGLASGALDDLFAIESALPGAADAAAPADGGLATPVGAALAAEFVPRPSVTVAVSEPAGGLIHGVAAAAFSRCGLAAGVPAFAAVALLFDPATPGWFAFDSTRSVGFASTALESTDWTGSTEADGRVVLVKVGSLTPSNDNIANFDAAAPAAKQLTAPVRISAAFSGPHPRRGAGGGALILDGRHVASRSTTAEEPSRFQ
jgi:hypothetical protein